MKKTNYLKHMTSCIFLALCLISSSSVTATDGYFSLGYGAMSKGMGGVGVSMYHMSLINGNPAGNVFLGNQYSLGVAIFNPNRQYTITGNPSQLPGTFGLTPGLVESDSKVFVIPNLGANWTFGANNNNAIGIAIFGNGGMNTDYPTATFHDQSSATTGVNFAQLFTNITYSRKLGQKHSFGVTAIFTYQLFEAKGLSNFGGFSSAPTKLTNNDSDSGSGFGFKVGYMGEISTGLHFGASYQSKIAMSEFDDYAGLFAEQGDFDVPSSWTIGLSYEVSDKLTIAVDVKQILYSDIQAIANPMNLMTNSPTDPMGMPNPNFKPLGADGAWGFGWEDMTIFKVGLQYETSPGMTIRGGFSHGNNPIPETEVLFNILAPGVIENHLALGLSKSIGASGKMIHFSLNYALNSTVSGFNPLDFDPLLSDPATGQFVPNQMIDIEMNQIDFEVGLTF